jgi:N-acetylneuraminic acid mutarotase
MNLARIGCLFALVLLCTGSLVVSLNISAQETDPIDSWRTRAPIPTQRFDFATAEVNGKIYCIGGTLSTLSYLDVNEVYDPLTDSWEAKSPMPYACFGCVAGVVGERIFVIGGQNASFPWGTMRTVQVYDPTTDSWSIRAPMPTARYDLAVGVVDSRIYAFGGYQWGTGVGLSTAEAYDPSTNSWIARAYMPTPRMSPAAAVFNRKVYVMGGQLDSAHPSLHVNEVYDPATDSWSTKAPLPTSRSALGTYVTNQRIYAIGGFNPYVSSANEEYDPHADTWTTRTPMLTPRGWFGAAVANTKFLAIGGYLPGLTGANEEYTPPRGLSFSGYSWDMKDSARAGPGDNHWSNSSENVCVDENGLLHLKITYRNGTWWCTEVSTTQPLGHGKYIFYVASRVDNLDQNVVMALFSYKDDDHEVDVEFSKWGDINRKNAQYVVQPEPYTEENRKLFNIALTGDYSTHFFSWNPDSVFFESYHGHYQPKAAPLSNVITNSCFPLSRTAEGAKAYIQLRLCQGSIPPLDGKEVEVVITRFEFLVSGDIDSDHKCDCIDLFTLARAYGSDPTKSNWNSNADINNDATVDASDLSLLDTDYGKSN